MIATPEFLVIEAAKILTKLVIQTAWDLGNKRLDEPIQRAIFQASKKYVETYHMRHGVFKILGMPRSIAIESIYIAVHLLQELPILNFASLDDLESHYRLSAIRQFQPKTPTHSGIRVANSDPYLMVLGNPGAGKSTFLRKIGLEALKGNQGQFQHACIPVFIELKRFNTDDVTIQSLIIEEFRICGFPTPEQVAEQTLNQGRLLVLLDGLDEVPGPYINRGLQAIQDFVTRYDGNRCVVSCRTAAYHHRLPRFTDVVIAEFDEAQIEQFIYQWFQAEREQDTARHCWQLLQHPHYAAAKELAHTPLLLTFLCLVYDRTQTFPENWGALYRKALDIWLEEWAAEKRLIREDIYQGLHTDLEKVLLAELAYETFSNYQLFFSKQLILDHIQSFLEDTLDAPKYLNHGAILNTIEVQQGILVKRAEDIYSFSHLTLQEHLVAQYVSDRHLTAQVVTQHLDDSRWQGVFLNLAGLVGDRIHELLLLMEHHIQAMVQTPAPLAALVAWANQLTSSAEHSYKPAAARAVALCIGFTLAFETILDRERQTSPPSALLTALQWEPECDPTLARSLALGLDPQLAHDLGPVFPSGLTLADDIHQTLTMNLAFVERLRQLRVLPEERLVRLLAGLKALDARLQQSPLSDASTHTLQLRQVWMQALQLPSYVVIAPADELNAITRYLKANQLMVRCQKAAVRISRTVWEEIESRMLDL